MNLGIFSQGSDVAGLLHVRLLCLFQLVYLVQIKIMGTVGLLTLGSR